MLTWNKEKHSGLLLLGLIFLTTVLFRYWLISGNHIYFWYDQARDAYVSQQIINNRDLKIQGPSASGTNDTIYHGVLYYYLLGPILVLGGGNPFVAALVFGIVNSLAVGLIYWLVVQIFKDKSLALISAALLAINFEHSQYSTWLSNPSMGLLPVIIFFGSVWRLFYQKEGKKNLYWLLLMGVSLGIIEQSAFYSVYFWGVILIGIFFQSKRLKLPVYKLFSFKQIFVFVGSYGLLISTMVINQIKLYQAGIFSANSVGAAMGNTGLIAKPWMIPELMSTYFIKIVETLTPTSSWLGAGLMIMVIWVLVLKTSMARRWFFLSWLLAPLWLFIIQFRSSPHMLIGIEYPILVLLAVLIAQLFRKRGVISKIVAIGILGMYVVCQINAVQLVRKQNTTIFTYQKGVMLSNELKLIDRTYELAEGKPFSVSVWGSPYEYYITWAYLYDWYGKEKYGYLPSYFGTSQVGKYGPELLMQEDVTKPVHFLIEEPDITLVGDIYQQFIAKQNEVTSPFRTDRTEDSGFEKFGEYRLQMRK